MVHKRKVENKRKRRSKIYAYHVNETKTKTYQHLLKKDGMPSGAPPSLDAWVSLNIYLVCLGHPQAWALASHPSPHIETSSIFDHFIHTKLNRKLVRSVSIVMQIMTLSNVANPFIFLHCRYCNITFPWLIPPIKIDSFIKTSKTMQQKQNLS